MHTTCGLTINENADPAVKSDMIKALSVFNRNDFEHSEGNSDSHVKTSLMGNTLVVAVKGSKIQLGTWQGIFLCEFDGPRNRKVMLITK